MRTVLAMALLAASVTAALAQYDRPYNTSPYGTGSNPNSHAVDGYTRDNGTYVQPHQQTNPNSTQYDNYGTRGNYNPYSNTYGTHSPRR